MDCGVATASTPKHPLRRVPDARPPREFALMRIPARPLVPIATAVSLFGSGIAAQDVIIDTYWQRESGVKEFDGLAPFRSPKGMKILDTQRSQLVDLLRDLKEMRNLAAQAKEGDLYYDKTGREMCKDKNWQAAYENVKANSLKMEGDLGQVFMQDQQVLRRHVCAYGMFYFNNPQKIINLISFLPGEPTREIREDGFQRALQFLRVHLPESRPQNPARPDNGIVVPRYEFNPLPFMQLLDQLEMIDRAQGLWFLAEVLRIRPDLGKAYFKDIRENLPALLTSELNMVRVRATDFLARVDRKRGRVPGKDATNEDRLKWLEELDYELFPPIRHISTGRCELYESDDLKQIIKAGKHLLSMENLLPKGSARMVSGSFRYGIKIARLPKPLDKLGIPLGALIVSVNGAPVRGAQELKGIFVEHWNRYEKSLKTKKPLPKPIFMVEYIHNKKAKMKEFRLKQ